MKIVLTMLLLILIMLLFSEEWQVSSIIDIGNGEKLLYKDIALTHLGAFHLTDSNKTVLLFNGNMKSIDFDRDIITALTYDNILKLYSVNDSEINFMYSITMPYSVNNVCISDSLIFIETENACYIKLIDTLNAISIPNYNISYLDFAEKNDSNIIAVRNSGEMITYGIIKAGKFEKINSLFSDSATFILRNKYDHYFSNSVNGKLAFYHISNDSLKKLTEKISPHDYIMGFSLDSLFALSTQDSVYIVNFVDSVNMTYIDSFENINDLTDIKLNEDTIYLLSNREIKTREIHSSSSNSFCYSKNIESIISDTKKYILFAKDTIFIYDTLLSLKQEKPGLLFTKNSYAIYDDSSVFVVLTDTALSIDIPFIPSGIVLKSDSISVSSKSSIIYNKELSDTVFSVMSYQSFPFYDFCIDSDKIFTASGFYGICRTDNIKIKHTTFGGIGFFNRIFYYDNNLYAAVNGNLIIDVDTNLYIFDTLFSGNFNEVSLTHSGILISTDDSLIKYDSLKSTIKPSLADYKGIKASAVLDSSAIFILEGGAVIYLNKNLTYRKEPPNKIIEGNSVIMSREFIDICGRVFHSENNELKNGIYFLYDKKSGIINKIVKLK